MNLSIGKRIQSFRKQKGMSQQDLSDHLGITRQAISKWELDHTLPDLETLVKMSELFDVSINELIGVEKNEKSVSEAYDQIQIVLQNIEKQNKKRNIIEIILISFLVICLLVMNVKSTTNQPVQTNLGTPNISQSLSIKEFDEFFNTPDLNQYFLTKGDQYDINMDRVTYFNVSYFDLSNWEVAIDYCIVLNEYSEDTQVSINFNGIPYELKKESENTFKLNEKIPLMDYENVTIKIENTSGKTIVEKAENVNYLTYALQCQILLYLRAYNNQTQLDTLYYIPYFNNSQLLNGNFLGDIHGDLTVHFFDENYQLIGDSVIIDLAAKSTSPLTEALPTNKKIYITMDYNIHKKDSERYYRGSLHSINEDGQSDTYFMINDTTKDYEIGFHKQ